MLKDLEVVIEDASSLASDDQEAFAMIRRVGLGASDSSVILNVNPFPDNTISKLIEQKRSRHITEAERRIGQMVNVRKGSDLEPIIMRKFEEEIGHKYALEKPKAMYRIPKTPLTVNFDGVMTLSKEDQVPVECKFVSTYAFKYWDFSRALPPNTLSMGGTLSDITSSGPKYIIDRAKEAGIPVYYYTQVQQQLMALNASFGYIVALFDKDWEIRIFQVLADKEVWRKLHDEAVKVWEQIKA